MVHVTLLEAERRRHGGGGLPAPSPRPRPEQGDLSGSPLSPVLSGRLLRRRVQDAPPGPRPPGSRGSSCSVLADQPAALVVGRRAGRALGPRARDRTRPAPPPRGRGSGGGDGRGGGLRPPSCGGSAPGLGAGTPASAPGPAAAPAMAPPRTRQVALRRSGRVPAAARGRWGAVAAPLGALRPATADLGARARLRAPALRLSERPGAAAAADRGGRHRRGVGDRRLRFDTGLRLAASTHGFLNPLLTQ